MKSIISLLFLLTIISLRCQSQEDTLEIFETDSVKKYDLIYLAGDKIENGVLIARYKMDTSKIAVERAFKNGVQHGWERVYFISGSLCVENHWRRGKVQGTSRKFTIQGFLDSEGRYKNGKKHGFWKGYLGPGDLIQKDKWKSGKLKCSIHFLKF